MTKEVLERVSLDDPELMIEFEPNHNYGGKRKERYEQYMLANTLGEARDLGALDTDLEEDVYTTGNVRPISRFFVLIRPSTSAIPSIVPPGVAELITTDDVDDFLPPKVSARELAPLITRCCRVTSQ